MIGELQEKKLPPQEQILVGYAARTLNAAPDSDTAAQRDQASIKMVLDGASQWRNSLSILRVRSLQPPVHLSLQPNHTPRPL